MIGGLLLLFIIVMCLLDNSNKQKKAWFIKFSNYTKNINIEHSILQIRMIINIYILI